MYILACTNKGSFTNYVYSKGGRGGSSNVNESQPGGIGGSSNVNVDQKIYGHFSLHVVFLKHSVSDRRKGCVSTKFMYNLKEILHLDT